MTEKNKHDFWTKIILFFTFQVIVQDLPINIQKICKLKNHEFVSTNRDINITQFQHLRQPKPMLWYIPSKMILVLKNKSVLFTKKIPKPHKWPKFLTLTNIIGKKHAFKKYDKFSLNASCFWSLLRWGTKSPRRNPLSRNPLSA